MASAPEAVPAAPGGAPAAADKARQRLEMEKAAEAQLLSKYGRLPAKNPMVAHALKQPKQFFDSGDWQLQQQGGLGQVGTADYGTDIAKRPLAYDHHNAGPDEDPKAKESASGGAAGSS